MAENQRYEKAVNAALIAIAAIAVIYHLMASHFLLLSADRHLNAHLLLSLLLVFLATIKKSKGFQFGFVLILASLACTVWVHFSMSYLERYSGFPQQPAYILSIGAVLMLLIVEGIRRSFGLTLTAIIILFILYPFFGRYLPGLLHAPPINPSGILFRQTIGSMGTGGIYGSLLSMSANAIFLFMVFASILQATGGPRFIMQIGRLVGRKLAGGPGLSAIVTSALIGTITGSVAANIAATGSFTIPLMKKVGYKPYQAGAIEAMASTGGQIMPPVMGYVAFLMIALTGIPYLELCILCAIPAVLYFVCGGLYVQFQAAKMGLHAKYEDVDSHEMLIFAPVFLVPLIALVVLLVKRFPLDYSVSIATLVLLTVALIQKQSRAELLGNWKAKVTEGAISGAQIALICAGMSMLLESMGMMALLLKIPALVITSSGGNLLIALILAMLASFILGSGAAASAAYVLVAIVIGPALIKMGLDVIQAHLFAFWFACIAFLTPPVAVGAAIASKVAGSPFWPTAIEATKVASGAFLIPYLMIWCPSIILRPTEPLWALLGPLAGLALIVVMQVTICGHYLKTTGPLERIFYGAVGVLLFLSMAFHVTLLTMLGLLLVIIGTVVQILKFKRQSPRETKAL